MASQADQASVGPGRAMLHLCGLNIGHWYRVVLVSAIRTLNLKQYAVTIVSARLCGSSGSGSNSGGSCGCGGSSGGGIGGGGAWATDAVAVVVDEDSA